MLSEDLNYSRGAPDQSLRWLRPFVPGKLEPVLRSLRKRWARRKLRLDEPFRTVFPFTQASMSRQCNLFRLANAVQEDRIPGAVVECGVLDGGMSGLMACATAPSGRAVHMFDSWKGLPETSAEDGEASKKWQGSDVGSQRRVAQCMKLLEIDPSRLRFHAGWFQDTFPRAKISEIALLHIDCDFFEPTRLCLDTWYPKLVSGGFVQLDDYDEFIGCRTAVDRFLADHRELQLEFFGVAGKACFFRKS